MCGLLNKLLVVVGAGASIDFGLPSVGGVADLLSQAAQERYPLFENSETNLYRYIESTITGYWRENTFGHRGPPNFEEVLYAVFALATTFPAGRFTSALVAFVTETPLPDVNFRNGRHAVDSHFLRQFGHYLVDTLLDTFRDRCRPLDVIKSAELEKMLAFFAALGG
jgi:hypothetical protein